MKNEKKKIKQFLNRDQYFSEFPIREDTHKKDHSGSKQYFLHFFYPLEMD